MGEAPRFDSLIAQARQARAAGDVAGAGALYRQASAIVRASADEQQLAFALRHVSEMERESGRADAALAAADEAIALYRSRPAQALDLANALRLRALALESTSRSDEGEASWREARDLYAQAGVEAGVAECDAYAAP